MSDHEEFVNPPPEYVIDKESSWRDGSPIWVVYRSSTNMQSFVASYDDPDVAKGVLDKLVDSIPREKR